MKHAFTSCLVACCLSAACSAQTEHVVSILGTGNMTTPSCGEFTDHTVIRQTNRGAAGIATTYEVWRRANGLAVNVSYTPSDSSLWSLAGKRLDTWHLDRYKMDILYERRFRGIKAFYPYAGAGAFVAVTWGGDAPAHSGVNATGFDAFPGAVIPLGVNTRITSRLSFKSGLMVDLGKASTYGDQTYRSSRNYMFEPQIGLTWRLVIGKPTNRGWPVVPSASLHVGATEHLPIA